MEYKLKLISALYNKIKTIICYFKETLHIFESVFNLNKGKQ